MKFTLLNHKVECVSRFRYTWSSSSSSATRWRVSLSLSFSVRFGNNLGQDRLLFWLSQQTFNWKQVERVKDETMMMDLVLLSDAQVISERESRMKAEWMWIMLHLFPLVRTKGERTDSSNQREGFQIKRKIRNLKKICPRWRRWEKILTILTASSQQQESCEWWRLQDETSFLSLMERLHVSKHESKGLL